MTITRIHFLPSGGAYAMTWDQSGTPLIHESGRWVLFFGDSLDGAPAAYYSASRIAHMEVLDSPTEQGKGQG